MFENFFRKILSPYLSLTFRGVTRFVPDTLHLRLMYCALLGKRLNLDNPATFNEKIQWLKLHDRDPLYTILVDKYNVKRWVAELIGEQYVTPTYAVWGCIEDIDISSLPERFVLKTNHDCGGVVICRDRSTFDLDEAKEKLAKHLKRNYYWGCREWPYKDVKPLVFAEEYLEPGENIQFITDYKFYCFDGKPKYLYVSQGLEDHSTACISFLNISDWSFAPFGRDDYASFTELPEKPDCYDEMERLARKLADDIPFVRVDLFVYEGRPRFSEMTFSPCGGFMPFDKPVWDAKIGELLASVPFR